MLIVTPACVVGGGPGAGAFVLTTGNRKFNHKYCRCILYRSVNYSNCLTNDMKIVRPIITCQGVGGGPGAVV